MIHRQETESLSTTVRNDSDRIAKREITLLNGTAISQQKRSELLDRLHNKISLSADFITIVENLQEAQPSTIPKVLANFKLKVRVQFPAVTDELLRELKELSSDSTVKQLGRYLPEFFLERGDAAATQYRERAIRFAELQKNSDLVYVERTLRLCDSLVAKAAQVENLANDPSILYRKLAEIFKTQLKGSFLKSLLKIPKISALLVDAIKVRNFAIVVDLSANKYERIFGAASNGVMFAGSPLCFIKGGRSDNERELTTRHEVMHHLIDGNEDWIAHIPPKVLLERIYVPLLAKVKDGKETKDTARLRADQQIAESILTSITHSDLCRCLRHEYFAALDPLLEIVHKSNEAFANTGCQQVRNALAEQIMASLCTTLTAQLSEGIHFVQACQKDKQLQWAQNSLTYIENTFLESLSYHLLFPYIIASAVDLQIDDQAKKSEVLNYIHAGLKTLEPFKLQQLVSLLEYKFHLDFSKTQTETTIEFGDIVIKGVLKDGKLTANLSP